MVGFAQAAKASVVTLSIDTAHIAAYDNTSSFNPVPFALNALTTGVVYELPIMFQLDGLAPGQSFGNISLDVTVTGGLTKKTGPGGTVGTVWYGNSATYPSGKGTQAYFDSNSDAGNATADGPGTQDGLNIAAYINAGTPSPERTAMGIGSPFLLGWAYFKLPADATSIGTVTITPTQFSYSQGGVLTVDNSAQLVGTSYTFVVPEPASICLVSAGLFCVMTRRRSAGRSHGPMQYQRSRKIVG
jgi:hypothetical protein